jgi:hypothetical protein
MNGHIIHAVCDSDEIVNRNEGVYEQWYIESIRPSVISQN